MHRTACGRTTGAVVVTTALLALVAPATAGHHSNSAFDVEVIHEVTGVVEQFRWANPHTWIYLDVDDGNGDIESWALEGRPPGILRRAGWSPGILKPGQRITVHYSPAKDGSRTGLVARVTLDDGTILANAPPPTR